MKSSLSIPAALFLAVGAAWFCLPVRPAFAQGARAPVISFGTYKLAEENVEGPNVERTYFTVGTKRMAFGVPKGCRLSVDGEGFVLTPTEAGVEGSVHVTRSPFTPDLDLAENALQYREAAAGKLPRGADGVVVKPPVMNSYPYNGWKSLGFVWEYVFYGRALRRTVGYINLQEGVQIMVTTEAGQTDAEKVDKMAQQFMGSWWVMKSEGKPPAAADG